MTTALEGVRGQRHDPAALYPRERPGTHCTGSWVGPRGGSGQARKILPPPGFDPRTFHPVTSRHTVWVTRPTVINSNSIKYNINLLKPTGHVMQHRVSYFNNCTLCPHCIYVFCIYLRTNSELCHLQHKLIGFYNRDEKCLHRGTKWVFK
jgi:hypothetical protein